ncbi:ABC transporter permease [Flavihumibacter rivuli]|uniref:ABC transporter permease n=1 Tax=Flavihumibacter rivuli TaxID=2838156 RepID=UPI001BDE3E9B|nr:ABC transporter permease subunit [Flavihumibacter rivuli]ULQ56373.1 ABC transporter permease [Flavihumibacter rivuli]
MWQLLRIELYKIFKRPRTYISFAAIGAIVMLILLAFYVDGRNYMAFGLQSLTQTFDIEGKVLNGYLICFIILQTLLIHVPLLIALVAGDLVAGEANMGTLRLLITKPVSRTELMFSKFLASVVYTMMLLVWMAILSLLVSVLVFGLGDLMILKSEEVVVLNKADVLWRYFAAFGFAAIAMTTVAALSFLLSIFAENSIGPIVTTMSVIIVFTILTTMDIPVFNKIKPFLFTTHMIGWKGFFDAPVVWESVLTSAGVLVLHIIVFVGAAIAIFRRKDILS